jgi:hypothetical protein
MAIGLSGDFFLVPFPVFIPLRFLLSQRTIRVFGSRTLRSSRDSPGDTSEAQGPPQHSLSASALESSSNYGS